MIHLRLFIFVSFFLIGCVQHLPVEMYIDDNFSDEEEDMIISAMDRWEKATNTNIFSYQGRYIDSEFDINDMGDRRHVIYKITEPTPASDMFVEFKRVESGNENADLFGWGMHSDILIYWYNLLEVYIEGVAEEHLDEAHQFLMWKLEDLTMHEIGHLLWLGHNNNPESIMCASRKRNRHRPSFISEYDVERFRRLYNR